MSERAVPEEITIIGVEEAADRAAFRRAEARYRREAVPTDEVKRRLEAFVAALGEVVSDIRTPVSGFSVDEITVNAEINAKGKLSLLGSGGEVGGSGGITITFKRDEHADKANGE